MNSYKNFILLKRLLNSLIKNGKKLKALNFLIILLKNLRLSEKYSNSTLFILYKAFENAKPVIYLQKFRKSSKLFYLPKLISNEQKVSLSLKWLKSSLEKRSERHLGDRLSNEILDCFTGKGFVISKKISVYKILLTNRPFLNLLLYK